MTYDLIIIVPVSGKEPFCDRLQDFKAWGLQNVWDYKILVLLAVCPQDELINWDSGWPLGVDVQLVMCDLSHEAPKVCQVLSEYLPESGLQYRWLAKIDDDSITNIGRIIEQIDILYNDPNYCWYLCTEVDWKLHPVEVNFINKMELHYLIEWSHLVNHEVEGCILNAVAVNKILGNDRALNYLKLRAGVDGGYSDQPWGVAARLSNVFPIHAPFMTFYANLSEYLNGRMLHIHGLSRDKTPQFMELMYQYIGNKPDIALKVENHQYLYYGPHLEFGRPILKKNHTIRNYDHPNEKLWAVLSPEVISQLGNIELVPDKPCLCFLDNFGVITTVFHTITEDGFEGTYRNRGTKHYLKVDSCKRSKLG